MNPGWLAYEVPSGTYFDHAAPRALVASHDHLALLKSITHRGGCSLSKATGMTVYQEAFTYHCLLGRGLRVRFRKIILYSRNFQRYIKTAGLDEASTFMPAKHPSPTAPVAISWHPKLPPPSDSGDSSNYKLLSQQKCEANETHQLQCISTQRVSTAFQIWKSLIFGEVFSPNSI